MQNNGEENICPVVKAIANIKTGGLYSDEDQEENSVKIKDVDYVCDNVSFYTNLRIINFARFELLKPTIEQYKEKFAQLYPWIQDGQIEISPYILYNNIIESSKMGKYIYSQFIRIVDSIANLEKFISDNIIVNKNYPLNISLPTLVLPYDANIKLIYSPQLLQMFMNKIISYVNNINLSLERRIEIDPIAEFTDKIPDDNISISSDLAAYRENIHKLLDAELRITQYLRKIEQYHCLVINHTNRIFIEMSRLMR